MSTSDGCGSKFLDSGRIGVWSNFCCLGQIVSAIFGLGLENFPRKSQIFQLFDLRVKKILIGSGQKVPGSKPDWPFIYCRSKVCSKSKNFLKAWVNSLRQDNKKAYLWVGEVCPREMVIKTLRAEVAVQS